MAEPSFNISPHALKDERDRANKHFNELVHLRIIPRGKGTIDMSHVLAAAAAGFEVYVTEAGGDPDRVLGNSGLRSDDIADPTRSLALSSYCEMLESAAAATRNPNFGLRYGAQFKPQMFGLIGFIALASPTAGAALGNFVDMFPLHQNGTETRIYFNGEVVRMEYRILDPAISNRRQDAEFTIAAFANLARLCLGDDFTPVRIDFEHPAPESQADHHHIFDADVLFLQPSNALVLRATCLDARMPEGNLSLLNVLRSSLEALTGRPQEEDVVARVRAEIRGRLATGPVTLAAVADRLRIPSWTMQRRLSERGISYSDLIDDVRRDLAGVYLRQPHLPLTDIAQFLGYSEPSAFSRAFRHWHDCAPSAYRKSLAHIRPRARSAASSVGAAGY
jgi:AraC-like DNA-binding protein